MAMPLTSSSVSPKNAAERLNLVLSHLNGETQRTTLHQQVAIVTGGAQGIGKAAAQLLAANGARIVIVDLDKGKAEEAVAELQQAGHDAMAVVGDLLDPPFADEVVAKVLKAWGTINILINNAGFTLDSAIHKMEEASFDIIMKIHNYAPFRLIKALAAHWMAVEHRGMNKVIINISSTSGLHGAMGQINYATAKSGINGLTKTVAAEWGRKINRYNVRCNSVAYGWIDTRITQLPSTAKSFNLAGQVIRPGIPASAKRWRDISDIPLGRIGTVEDAAGVILFLASPLSNYVTGTCIECTGGRYM